MNSLQAFFLLRHSLSIPMVTFLLRTTPCWRSRKDLIDYDSVLKAAVEVIIVSQSLDSAVAESTQSWKSITQSDLLPLRSCKLQINWDDRMCAKIQEELLHNNSTEVGRARPLAGGTKEAGAWLTAFPAASLSNLLDHSELQ